MQLPKKLQIKVTQQHIEGGIAQSDEYCPIALVVKELLGGDNYVEVDGDQIIINDVAVYDLPDNAREFIRAFDNDEAVQPFEFETGECVVAG